MHLTNVSNNTIDHTRYLTLGLLLSITILLAFVPGSYGDWIFDDFSAIRDNADIGSPTLKKLLLPTPDSPVAGRPLLNLSFVINHSLSQTNAITYRRTNIAIHILSSWLLFALLIRLINSMQQSTRISATQRTWAAFFITLLWAIHPLQTECVLYVTQRSEQLVTLALFASVYCLIRHHQTAKHQTPWLIGSVLACFSGILCKESAAVYPIVILLADRAFLAGDFKALWKQRRGYYIALFTITWTTIALILATGPRSQSTGFSHGITSWQYLMTQSQVIVHYFKILVIPSELSLAYDWPIATHLNDVMFSFIAVSLLFVASCIYVIKLPRIGFATVSLFLILAPSSSFYPIVTEVAADRRMCVPLLLLLGMIGLTALVRLTANSNQSNSKVRVVMLLCIGITAVMFGMTVMSGYRFNDSQLLWHHTIRTAKDPMTAKSQLAQLYTKQNQLAPAHQLYVKLHHDHPELNTIRFNLGLTNLKLNRIKQGIELLKTVDINSSVGHHAQYYLGVHARVNNQTDMAIEHLFKAWEAKPQNPKYALNLAQMLMINKQYQQAIDTLLVLPEKQRQSKDILTALGYSYSQTNQLPQASKAYEQYLKLDANDAAIHNTLGIVYARMGLLPKAIAAFNQALQIHPNMSDAQANLKRAQDQLDELQSK